MPGRNSDSIKLSRIKAINFTCSGYLVNHRGRVGASINKNLVSPHARPDIDGLRAVAVLLVLFFHGGSSVFPSGFIGVDIFFVISGYLIASVISKDISSGNFSLARFYERRIWRLQPAVIALYITTGIIAALIYLPADFLGYLKSAKFASLFLSNQYFERVTTAYAAEDSASLLLLHTWSLSIEWQWYLLMPISLSLLHKILPPKALAPTLGLITLAAVVLMMVLSNSMQDKSYYFFESRIFELLIGSCVAIFGADRLNINRFLASVVGFASLFILGYCATRVDILSGYPDYHACLVSFSAAMLLIRGVGVNGFHGKVLGGRLAGFIGLISYSLYLYHWPVLAMISYLGLQKNSLAIAFYYGISFVLAIASYYFVEQRLRYKKIGFCKSLVMLVVAPAILCTVVYEVGGAHSGWPARFGLEYASSFKRLNASFSTERQRCIDGSNDAEDPRCLIGSVGSARKALMIGDSFSNQYWGFIDVLAKDQGLAVSALSTPLCLALPDIFLYDWWRYKNTVYKKCHDNVASNYEAIKDHHYQYVIIGQSWDAYSGSNVVNSLSDARSIDLSRGRIVAAMRKSLDTITQSGATPVLIKSVAAMPAGLNECLLRPLKFRGMFDSKNAAEKCSSISYGVTQHGWFDAVFESFRRNYPSLIVIDPKDIQCKGSQCASVIDGVPVYRDEGHITDYASYKFGYDYLKMYGNPFRLR